VVGEARSASEIEVVLSDGVLLLLLNGLEVGELRERAGARARGRKSGYRSSIAKSQLEAAGFERVTDLAGGMDAWSASPSGACTA
jgi:hypothetical protein